MIMLTTTIIIKVFAFCKPTLLTVFKGKVKMAGSLYVVNYKEKQLDC